MTTSSRQPEHPAQLTTASEATTMHSWAVVIAQTLEQRGINSKALFEQAGVPYKLAVNPSLRVPTSRMNHLFQLAIAATGDECFGLNMVEFIHPTTFHALGYSLYASSTLEDFFERIVRFFQIASDNCRHHIEEDEHDYRIRIELLVDNLSFETQEGWTATIAKFTRAIFRPGFNPRRVRLLRPAISDTAHQQFERYFRCPVEFGAGQWEIIYDRAHMTTPLPGANHELALINDNVVMDYLAKREKSDLVSQVRALIIKLLPSGNCTKEFIAARLNMSPRSLQHKLSLQGTSYQDLLEEIRKDLAEKYIADEHNSVSEIAYLLGFSDTGNFSRAFKRWHRLTPSQYRSRKGRLASLSISQPSNSCKE